MTGTLRAFTNDGGPLMLLPSSARDAWEGGDAPSGGRIIDLPTRYALADAATDYDRACQVNESAMLLDVGPGWGLAVDAGGATAAWLSRPSDSEHLLAVVFYSDAPSLADLRGMEHELAGDAWEVLAPALDVPDGGLLLLHAASTPRDVQVGAWDDEGSAVIGDAIDYPIPAGRYAVRWCWTERADGPLTGGYIFVRFAAADG